jgi:hypothetical protein
LPTVALRGRSRRRSWDRSRAYTGTFLGPDTFAGRPILVRFLWLAVSTAAPRWEQAFSTDDGGTWETNRVMTYTRIEEAA